MASSDMPDLTARFEQQCKVSCSCKESKDKFEKILEDKGVNVEFDSIDYFYHATSKENKKNIERDGCLKKNMARPIRGSKNSPIEELEGVFFCGTLSDRKLPKKSPYGTERVCIPVEFFLKNGNPCLFYNSYHVVYCWGVNIYYVILVLVDKNDPAFSFCNQNLVRLNRRTNPFLRLWVDHSSARERYRCMCFSNSNCNRKFKIYVEVFVVGDVKLPTSAVWHEVQCTGRSRHTV